MLFNIGDLVTRKSYHNDIVFKIESINNDIALLYGVDIRLCADSKIDDLVKASKTEIHDEVFLDRLDDISLNRDEFFYLPGKIVQLDSDGDFLKRCLNFYERINVKAKGIKIKESKMSNEILSIIEEYKPDILVITGHDAYNKRNGDEENLSNYKNTINFINAVREARKKASYKDLIIIAGACQSNYEELIKAGANFASSPKRINIHALDPAIIAVTLALSDRNKPIDIVHLLEKTKYGKDGMGGVITNGTMYVGYPR